MKITLIGYGKMGQMVEKMAHSMGHSIVGHCTSKTWDLKAIQESDICIDFTEPEVVLENIFRVIEYKKPIIVGTTGWYDHLELVRKKVGGSQTGLLYGSNFSIGVYLFLRAIRNTASMIGAFPEYDIAGIEYHHNQKKDSPSGTAKEMIQAIEASIPGVAAVPFASVRCGSIPGTHTVLFDSPCDTLTFTHTARTREGFAKGAVLAAEWLIGKQGVYSFQEYMEDFIQKRERA